MASRSDPNPYPIVNRAAAHHRQHRASFDLPSGERRGMPLREERRRVDRPARPEVQHRKVGRLPRFDASRKSEDPARVRRHQVDQPFQRQKTPPDQPGVEQRKGRLDPHDAHGAPGQPARLLLVRMRGVVRGDDLDRAVQHAGQQRLAVGTAPQRRVHLEASLLLQILVAQQQVVRRRLAAHAQTLRLRLPHQFDALLRGDVADVVPAAGLRGQRDVALHLPPLALRRDALMTVGMAVGAVVDISSVKKLVDLAVRHDRLADRRGSAHRLLHEFGRLHPAAVVREPHDLRSQRREVRQFAAPALSHGDRPVGDDPHRSVAADDLQLPFEVLRRIGRRVQVGHRADRRIAAAGRRGRTRGDGLLLREARFAQMDMHVHQPRNKVQPPEIDDPVVRPRRRIRNHPVRLHDQPSPLETTPSINPGVLVKRLHRLRNIKK